MASEPLSNILKPEEGWYFAVPPPNKCAPGLIPYPIIIHGPDTQGQVSKEGKYFECETSLYRLAKNVYGLETSEQIEIYAPVKGEGLGSIESGILVVYDIKVTEPGRYKLRTCFNVYDMKEPPSMKTIRHVLIYSEPFTVVDSFDNSTIRLIHSQINLIKEAINANTRLQELYGDLGTKLESNWTWKRQPAVSSSPPNEGGWKYVIHPPPVIAPGELPYPIILERPGMVPELPDSRKVWQGSTIIYKLDPNKVEGESETEWDSFSEGGFNVGPFGVGRAVIAGIKVNEEGTYRFDHIISLVDSVQKKEERHVVARTWKIHVTPTFDNSTLRLDKAKSDYVRSLFTEYPTLEDSFEPYLHTED